MSEKINKISDKILPYLSFNLKKKKERKKKVESGVSITKCVIMGLIYSATLLLQIAYYHQSYCSFSTEKRCQLYRIPVLSSAGSTTL